MINYKEIKEKLPQRYPFIMIESAEFFEKEELLKSYMCLSNSQSNHSIYPFSLIIEGAAQSCILLYKMSYPYSTKKDFLLAGINNSQINRQCTLGEKLIYECVFIRLFEKGAFSKVNLYIDTEYIGEIKLNFYMN